MYLSFPTRGSVNDGIASDLASITYALVDDAVRLILRLGRGMQLVKLDLKNAYRIVPVHPQDQHLLYGCGAVVDAESWFQVSCPEEWEAVDISVKKLLPVVVAAALLTWQGNHIHFHSDNMIAFLGLFCDKTDRLASLEH